MYKSMAETLVLNLRHELISAISDYKAYEVPLICARLGLADGTEEEAFRSKYKYAASRLAAIGVSSLVEKARTLLEEIDVFQLREAVEKISDLQRPEITKLTRRRLIKLLGRRLINS